MGRDEIEKTCFPFGIPIAGANGLDDFQRKLHYETFSTAAMIPCGYLVPSFAASMTELSPPATFWRAIPNVLYIAYAK